MKKIISIIILITLITNAQVIFSAASDEMVTYEGNEIYKSIYKNIDFNDVNNHWSKPNVYKMSALSIIKGLGNKQFNPNGNLSKEQSIIFLTRLLGLEKEAVSLGEASIKNNDTGKYKILSSYDYWVRGYIQVALNNNIISKEEYDEITTLSDNTKEAIDKIVEQRMVNYEKDFNLNQNQLDNIEAGIRELEEKRYTWGQNITREQIAIWVARIMNLEPISGQEQHLVFNLEDWKEIDTKNIPIIESIIKKRIMIGNNNSEFNPKGSLTRGEMSKILDIASEKFLPELGYTINSGIVEKINEIKEADKDLYNSKSITINKKEFIVNTDNDDSVKLITQTSNEGVNEKGFITYKKNSLGYPSSILASDYIKYYIDSLGKVVYVEVLDRNILEIQGFVEDVNNDNITIKDFNNKTHVYNVSSGADITINNSRINLTDLLYGQEVKLKVNNGIVTNITGYLDEGEPGAINPGDRVYVGKVLYIDNIYDKITILDGNKELKFSVDDNTPIIKENTNINFGNIKEGDTVRLEFDEYNSNYPSKIYVSSNDKDLSNVYKGKINYYNTSRNEIVLNEVKYFKNSKWNDKNDLVNINLDYNTNVYLDNVKIDYNDLNKYINKEAYIVTVNDFGKEKAYKIILKTDYETSFNDKLQDISFGYKNIKIDYTNVEFDYDSTIVVKNGRLVHPYNIKYGDTLSLIAQGIDNPIATFISIEETPDTGIMVYKGKIEDIGRYSITLDNFDVMEDSTWYYESDEEDIQLSNDTKIIDTRSNYKEISVDEFTNSRYLGAKDYKNYVNKYAFAVEYNNILIGLNIINSNTAVDVISTGDISNIDILNSKIKLDNIKDFNRLNDKWTTNDSVIDLDLTEALIIRNGKIIKSYELKKNDSLYVLRKNHEGYVVIVK